ncbi:MULTISPECIES: YbbR-like domain-containing protein [unclassified Granulicatella]|uniref:CdaR family protein n=1 Tax=unclassified Granulicatella TaxID=2630493 RepID=UPI00107417A0|nr:MULTISPECIES: CdaR family protein [unclassified Granulicatella]MBF0780297.1 hypothetical protein [Granulicatella sp. 19428wC4_WM01]TFU95575.1 hypothetical protein E4T68_04215 [Granulicatella sp. WM01]
MSVLLAIMLSTYVYNRVNSSTTNHDNMLSVQTTKLVEDVPIHVIDSSGEKYISGLPEKVTVSLDGPRNVLAQLTNQTLTVETEDLVKFPNGEVGIQLLLKKLPSNVTGSVVPRVVNVQLDERVQKEFAVNAIIDANIIADGYEMGNVTVSPEKVTLTGSREAIEKVHTVTANVSSGVAKTESFIQTHVAVVVKDSQGNILDVNVDKKVSLTVPVYQKGKKVPVEIVLAGQQNDYTYKVESQTVSDLTLLGTTEQLEKVSKITATINVSQITQSQTLEATVLVPQGITISNPQQVKANIKVERKVSEGE